MKKMIVAIILIGCLLSTSIASVNAFNMEEISEEELEFFGSPIQYGGNDDEIVLTFSFDEPVITEINRDDDIYVQVAIEGLQVSGDTGVPLLPVKPVDVLLPQRTMIESISVTKEEAIVLGDGYNVELGVEPTVIGMVSGEELVETVIGFDPMVLYPLVDFENVGVFDFRGYSVLTLVVYPVRYLGSTGELSYFDEITVTITTVDVDDVNPLFRGLPGDDLMMREMVDDYSCSNTYVVVNSEGSLPIFGDSYEYVVITSEELKNADGSYTFQDLVQYKNDNGISATIVTVEEIYDQYDGVDNPEKIRNFTKDAYLNWGTEYVLLGGDLDVVPARFLYVESWEGGYETDTPADLYYGCLDGSFNFDGDELWGEPDDGPDGEDVDLVAEVYVGRACVGNESEVSNFVMKTLTYEQTPVDDPYLKKALMVGEHLGWALGGDYKDEIINGSSNHWYSTAGIPFGLYNIDTLYDRDGTWQESEIIDRINTGFNILNHLGHSSFDYNMKMTISDVYDLINDEYCFIYSQGCMAGGFDDPGDYDCIAEYFTVKNTHGAFAGIWNARYGWGRAGSTDGPSQRFDREFFDAIFNEGVRDSKKTQLGVANQDSKEDNLWRINDSCMRWCYYVLNLFGDPQVSLKPVPVYEHDLAVDSLTLSDPVLPGESFTITTKIVNQGLSDEIGISGNILIIEILDTVNIEETQIHEYPWSIDSLDSGDDVVFELDYLLPRGLYQISSNIQPHPGEEVLFNNHMGIVIFIGENTPPEKPAEPSGPTDGKVGEEYTYSTSTNDPEGDKMYYQWFWGCDPMFPSYCYYSDWLGPYNSGEIIYTSNVWNYEGEYIIKVRAMDVYWALGDWSDPLSVAMPVSQPDSSQSGQSSNSPSCGCPYTQFQSQTSGQSNNN